MGVESRGSRVAARPLAAVARPAGRPASPRPPAAGSAAPDLAFLRGRAPRTLLASAARLAALRRTDPGAELLAAGFDPGLYWSSVADDLGLRFRRDLRGTALPPGAAAPAPGRIGSLLVLAAGRPMLAIAPGAAERAALRARLAAAPQLAARLVIVPPQAIRAFVATAQRDRILDEAVSGLARRWPALSARRPRRLRAPGRVSAAASVLLAGALLAAPSLALPLLGALLTLFFANGVAWRLAAALSPVVETRCEPLPDALLPSYSVLVPLYREAAVVADLLRHLSALRYPAPKLQVLLVCEADDRDTLAAIAAAGPGPAFETVIVPPGGPRTKPKALAYALAFARGDMVVVYDAEDRPEPDQLRRAAALFRHRPGLGCVQARLVPDNRDTLLACMFAVEYAANFEILLPALARWGVPLPLGGTSNHFPRRVLDEVGGWDPYNVTEDADLGIRLARFGYRSATLPSRTFEEAPVGLDQWLPQRRRWLKGWIQTALVCRPGRSGAAPPLSPRDMLAVHAILTAGIVGLLLYPATLVAIAAGARALLAPGADPGPAVIALVALGGATFAVNLAAAAIASLRGLRAAGALRLAWLVPLLPLHWALVSFAAWQALIQFLRTPSTWEKTAHGLARDRRPPRREPVVPGP